MSRTLSSLPYLLFNLCALAAVAQPPSPNPLGGLNATSLSLYAGGTHVLGAEGSHYSIYVYGHSSGKLAISCLDPSGEASLHLLNDYPYPDYSPLSVLADSDAFFVSIHGPDPRNGPSSGSTFVIRFRCTNGRVNWATQATTAAALVRSVSGQIAGFSAAGGPCLPRSLAPVAGQRLDAQTGALIGGPVNLSPCQAADISAGTPFGIDNQFGARAQGGLALVLAFWSREAGGAIRAGRFNASDLMPAAPATPTQNICSRLGSSCGGGHLAPFVRGSASGETLILTPTGGTVGAEVWDQNGNVVADWSNIFPNIDPFIQDDGAIAITPVAPDGWAVAAAVQSSDFLQRYVIVNTVSPLGVGTTPLVLTLPGHDIGDPQWLGDNRLAVQASDPVPYRSLGEYEQQIVFHQNCTQSDTTLCLNGGRFRVDVTDVTDQGAIAAGHGQALTDESGYFWFFAPSNVEMLVKVLDGCALNGHYWVFAAGLTNVLTNTTVVDTATGALLTFSNPLNTPFAPYQNTSAFPCQGVAAD